MIPRVVVLTDRTQLPPGRSLAEQLVACLGAGLDSVILREHDLPPVERSGLLTYLNHAGLCVLSSRLPDPVAAGIHLASDQPTPVHGSKPVRFGRSCHSAEEVCRAAAEGARWATLSPFGASGSKPGYGPPVPAEGFATGAGIPVLALGGIDPDTAADARTAGAHGVAVMGAVMRADDPARVVAELLEATR